MRILRRYIALFFIFCTLLVQTPRSWLHDCHDTEFSTFSHAGSSVEEDCDVCDQPALLSDINISPEIDYHCSCLWFSYPDSNAPVTFIITGLTKNKAPPVLPC